MYNSNNHSHPLNKPSTTNAYYEMAAMSKRLLISDSVTMIQIIIHPIGEEPDNMSYVWPLGSHIRQPPVKSLLGQNWTCAPGMKS
jgi:hypothetical protein